MLQVEPFFSHDKDLEPNKWVKLTSIEEAEVAKRMIMEAVERGKAVVD